MMAPDNMIDNPNLWFVFMCTTGVKGQDERKRSIYTSKITRFCALVKRQLVFAGHKRLTIDVCIDSVHPEIGKFGRDQGARKI